MFDGLTSFALASDANCLVSPHGQQEELARFTAPGIWVLWIGVQGQVLPEVKEDVQMGFELLYGAESLSAGRVGRWL